MTRSDLALIIYVVLLVPLMLISLRYARRGQFDPQIKITFTIITLVSWGLIGFVMGSSYEHAVIPQLPQHLNYVTVFIPSLHLITGAIAQILGTYLLIQLWFGNRLPKRIRVENVKPAMQTTLALWLITAALGLTIWGVFYHNFLISPPIASAADIPRAANEVDMNRDNTFAPSTITIKAGTALVFVNHGYEDHTATADDNSFDTGLVEPGKSSAPIVFSKPGKYPFYCQLHGAAGGVGMSGVIIVQ